MSLKELIVQRIKNDGPITFCDFMEMALYYPGLGYYSSPRNKLGKDGDFYTSPLCSSLFGRLIGRQLEEMWLLMGGGPFIIVEYGAGTGELCRDILAYIERNGRFSRHVQYFIIEKSGYMRELEKSILPQRVKWVDSISEIPSFSGCVLANELLDNFSVHRVCMQQELMEFYVDYKDGFKEILLPAGDLLQDYLAQLHVKLPWGYCTEINLQANDWVSEIANRMKRGYMITFDYGFTSSKMYEAQRSTGNMVCYYQHKAGSCPYDNIGEQDITTHVNFSALAHWGRLNGLNVNGYTNQLHFLQGLGLAGELRTMQEAESLKESARRMDISFIRNFVMELGSRIKVLVQSKEVRSPLSGLQFAIPLT
jgi:SAM-dependent MidA family methyltransferase